MTTVEQIIFMASSVGVVNGAVLGTYLLFRRPGRSKQTLLGLLLLAISLRVAKSVFLYFNPDLGIPVVQIGLSACFFIGPFCLAFLIDDRPSLKPLWSYWPAHFGILTVICLAWIFFYPHQPEKPASPLVVQIIYVQWCIYLSLSTAVVLWPILRRNTVPKGLHLSALDTSILIGCWFIWAAFNFSHYTSYIAGALSFTLFVYVSFYLFFRRDWFENTARVNKYASDSIPEDVAQETVAALEAKMVNESIFQDPNLTLPKLAKMLGITPQRLSRILNDNMGVSFNTYINKHRVESAKTLLCDENWRGMDHVIEACGFNTQSTFFKAFKALTKTTPARYRAENRR